MQLDNEKNMYLLWSNLNQYKKIVNRAIETSRKALQNSARPLLSFSGGKDSIVMLDIAVRAGFNGELVFFDYGICCDKETPRETVDVVTYYANKYRLKLNTIKCLGEFDCWNELGYFCIIPQTENEKHVFNKTNNDFRRKSNDFEKNHECDLSFIGMRKDESKQRKMTLCKNGTVYQAASRKSITCCPIANFSGRDVWAYIFSNNLRYPEFYDYPYESRENLRNEPTLLYNDAIIRNGHVQSFKTMFRDYISEIKNRYPEAVI